MTRRQRAAVAAAAIAPATVAGIALIRCGCSQVAGRLKLLRPLSFHCGFWRAEDNCHRQKATLREPGRTWSLRSDQHDTGSVRAGWRDKVCRHVLSPHGAWFRRKASLVVLVPRLAPAHCVIEQDSEYSTCCSKRRVDSQGRLSLRTYFPLSCN